MLKQQPLVIFLLGGLSTVMTTVYRRGSVGMLPSSLQHRYQETGLLIAL